MSVYPSRDPAPFDAARAEAHRRELARVVQITGSDPAFKYLVKHRGISAEIVLGCVELRYLPAPIEGRPKTDHACLSLLRAAPDGDVTGCELAFIDASGRPSAEGPHRIQWALVEHGCRNSWFFAGGSGEAAVVAEGFACKVLALRTVGGSAFVLGWGARGWLAHKKLPPGIQQVLVFPDRRPVEAERTADGKSAREAHDRDYRRNIDALLLALGDGNVLVAPDFGELDCKDADQVLIERGPEALRGLIERATVAELSADGWVKRLAALGDVEYDRVRRDKAADLGVRVATLDAQRRAAQQTAAHCGEADAARSRLVAIATEQDLFQDDGGDGFCAVELSDGAQRTLKIEGAAFTDWLIATYGRRFPETVAGRQVPGSVPSSTLADATRTILAVARQGDTRQVFLRLGWATNRLFLDMATPEPRAIEISPEGWAIVVDPPVHLVFSPTAKPLPVPVPTSRKAVFQQLRSFFGFRLNDDRLVLLIGVMMAGLMARGPYPILVLSGEQGSGKTTRSRLIKLAIDPTKASVRGRPRSAEDLAISVWRSWFGLFDNLSKLDQDMSDWLCRLSEGAGLPKRKLYTDSEEILIEAARPIMLTAIPDIAQSGDVIDRAVLIRCDPLPSKLREQVLLDRFEAFRPQLLAYLIEAASCALRRWPEMVDTHDGLRRGDWCAWVEAAAPALGIPEGAFTAAYRRSQDQSVRMALEVDAVGAAVLDYMDSRYEVEIAASPLHAALEQIARKQHSGRLPLDWPSMAHHFSGRLRRIAPMLRRVGILFDSRHEATGSRIRLVNPENRPADISSSPAREKSRQRASRASSASAGNSEMHDAADAPEAEKQHSSAGTRETHVGSGAGAPPETCATCGEALGNGRLTVAVPAGRAHFDCAQRSSAEAPPPPPKRSRIRRGARRA